MRLKSLAFFVSMIGLVTFPIPVMGQAIQDNDLYWLWQDPTSQDEMSFAGGALPVKKLVDKTEDGRKYTVIKTPRGGLLKVDSVRVVKAERKRSTLLKDYRTRLKSLNRESAVEHLELANWIRKMGGTRKLKRELEFHLQETVRIDPNIDEAWKKLGFDVIRGHRYLPQNKWKNHGYVKKLKGWVPEIVANLEQQQEQTVESLGELKKRYRVWKKTQFPNDVARSQALIKFITPELLPIIIKDAAKSNAAGKLIYLEAIGTLRGSVSQRALIKYSIQESNTTIQDRALTLLKQDFYNHAAAAKTIANSLLKSKQNSDIRRAAEVLLALEQKNTILELIHALVTEHEVRNPNAAPPGSINAGFDRTGRSNGISMPGKQPQVLKIHSKNSEVLKTLEEFTQQNFGYDEALWKAWYTQANTAMVKDLRGGR